MVFSFVGFLVLFIGIGLLSLRHSRATKQDYYVASGNVPP